MERTCREFSKVYILHYNLYTLQYMKALLKVRKITEYALSMGGMFQF